MGQAQPGRLIETQIAALQLTQKTLLVFLQAQSYGTDIMKIALIPGVERAFYEDPGLISRL